MHQTLCACVVFSVLFAPTGVRAAEADGPTTARRQGSIQIQLGPGVRLVLQQEHVPTARPGFYTKKTTSATVFGPDRSRTIIYPYVGVAQQTVGEPVDLSRLLQTVGQGLPRASGPYIELPPSFSSRLPDRLIQSMFAATTRTDLGRVAADVRALFDKSFGAFETRRSLRRWLDDPNPRVNQQGK